MGIKGGGGVEVKRGIGPDEGVAVEVRAASAVRGALTGIVIGIIATTIATVVTASITLETVINVTIREVRQRRMLKSSTRGSSE